MKRLTQTDKLKEEEQTKDYFQPSLKSFCKDVFTLNRYQINFIQRAKSIFGVNNALIHSSDLFDSNQDPKHLNINRLKWSVIYVGIGIVLVLVLPFPYDFSVLALFILINFLRGRSILKRYGGTGGIRDL
jgi:hypothetical protein